MIARLPDGLELAYDDVGSGAGLLFIHGWPHDRTIWAAQLSGLPTRARCLAPDLRGFGGSSVEGPYSMDQYADDLAAFLDLLHVESAVVCGLSLGGYIALAMYRRHRARMRALILTDTRAAADTAEVREKRQRLIAFVEERGVEALADTQVKAQLAASALDTRPELGESLRLLMTHGARDGLIGAQRAMMERPDSTGLLAGITVPTLVVGGAEDAITIPDELRALAAAIPGSQFDLIAFAGHVSPFERPAAFNHLVGGFLREHDLRA
jgi:pimeloyl-ACP methyl ester carboxylesterase